LPQESLIVINEELLRISRLFLSQSGLPERPWFKNQIYAPGAYTGYGAKPIAAQLRRIDGIKDKTQLAAALGATLRADVDVLNNTNLHTENLFGLWVAQDLSDPSKYAAFLLQGGLVMPDRDYYLNPSPKMADIRTRYQSHIEGVLQLAGLADARAEADKVYALEQRIAAAHLSRGESEDVLKGNNHWSVTDFGSRAPGLDWTAFFAPFATRRVPLPTYPFARESYWITAPGAPALPSFDIPLGAQKNGQYNF
jgi:predicted metalloendopeptidase